MHHQNNLEAQLPGILSTLEKLESEYAKGEIDVGRYLRLKTEYETRRTELEQALEGQAPLPPDLNGPNYAAARDRYLAALREQYGFVETHGFMETVRDERVGKPHRLSLVGQEGVYVPLTFDAPLARRAELETAGSPGKQTHLERGPDEREMRPLSLAEALELPGHLALIGDAGSGKTTVLHVIVSALAADDPQTAVPDLVAVLPEPRPIPVFLPLRLFEHACAQGDGPDAYTRCAADLLRFVDQWFARWCPAADLPPGFLSAHVRAGRAWLLLDALDEVADAAHRQTVRNVIKELAGYGYGTRVIVTARVAAYRGARLGDPFALITVRDLDREQRQRMVSAIYGGLALAGAPRRAEELSALIGRSEALQDLTRTPVMVWTAAVIHALRGELPDSRAALYDAYVDILLKQSFKRTRYDVAAVDELAGGQGWPLPDRRHYLTYAAFKIHALLEMQTERQGERRVVVDEGELADRVLAPYFENNLGLTLPQSRRQARQFIALMTERSGLLYESDQGYTIGDHLTMQEFLAGCYLGEHYPWEDPQGYADFLANKANHTWWREVVLLAAGYLAEKPGFAARQFLQQIAAQGQGAVEQLATLTLAARGLLQLRTRLQRPTWYGDLARQLAGNLYRRLYAEHAPTPVAARQDAGLALGLIHGYPGEDGPGDPRFQNRGGLPRFIQIEGGEFWMGSTEAEVERLIQETGKEYFKRELPRHRVYLDGFELARFPTTNAMFARFVDAGGYGEQRWWAEAIADGYWAEGKYKDILGGERIRPYYWDNARYNNPVQPVVGVSWYEAVAYCAWLTATLNDGHVYYLPTEAQWERAARGSEGWAYPWGDEWAEDHCNSEESGLGVTSPVGIFPRGGAQSREGGAQGGIEDMVGNVYEWCSDWYGEDYYARSKDARNPTGPEKGELRILRGGSRFFDKNYCRCGHRDGLLPGHGDNVGGFRCARILSS